VKTQVPHKFTDSFQSGYVAPATPRSKSAKVDIIENAKPNLLAKFLVTRELPVSDPRYKPINVWPENLPGFRETVTEYHASIEKLGRSFLPIWATSLKMPVDFFEQFFKEPHLTLSLLNYPPQKVVGNRQYGIAPHTDNSFMTFLAQSNVPGLAVRMPSGRWRVVENIPGTFLVNTGNVIMRWTNDRYLSTKHRVINTADVDRYSIPMFFGPSGDALIECIPTCQSPGRPARYEPITYRKLREWYYGLRD
jgi:isopenicillin N synthase-like dioxygenase